MAIVKGWLMGKEREIWNKQSMTNKGRVRVRSPRWFLGFRSCKSARCAVDPEGRGPGVTSSSLPPLLPFTQECETLASPLILVLSSEPKQGNRRKAGVSVVMGGDSRDTLGSQRTSVCSTEKKWVLIHTMVISFPSREAENKFSLCLWTSAGPLWDRAVCLLFGSTENAWNNHKP